MASLGNTCDCDLTLFIGSPTDKLVLSLKSEMRLKYTQFLATVTQASNNLTVAIYLTCNLLKSAVSSAKQGQNQAVTAEMALQV